MTDTRQTGPVNQPLNAFLSSSEDAIVEALTEHFPAAAIRHWAIQNTVRKHSVTPEELGNAIAFFIGVCDPSNRASTIQEASEVASQSELSSSDNKRLNSKIERIFDRAASQTRKFHDAINQRNALKKFGPVISSLKTELAALAKPDTLSDAFRVAHLTMTLGSEEQTAHVKFFLHLEDIEELMHVLVQTKSKLLEPTQVTNDDALSSEQG